MNIYDIAKEAGVSISTVSKYLNNKNIKPELKIRIEEVIKKYNYVPSAIARGLVYKSMKLVAVMVVDIRVSYYSAAAYAIDNELSNLGYKVIICNTLGDEKNTIESIESLIELQIDGIIFIGSIFEFLNKYENTLTKLNNIPVICNNGHINTRISYSVYVDDKAGIYNAVEYLINKGRKKIAYFRYLTTRSANLKYEGYLEALEKYNLKSQVYYTDTLLDNGRPAIEELLKNLDNIDAIVCGEDILALACIMAISPTKYKVGRDIDIIGFNASEYTDLSNPKITSVNNKVNETSIKCVDLLLDVLNNKEVEDITLACTLDIKESA